MADVAQIALFDHAGYQRAIGVEAQFVVDHVQVSCGARRRKHDAGLVGVHRHGLFAQDMRAQSQCCERHRGMQVGRRGDADQIGAMLGQHCLPVGIGGNVIGGGGGFRRFQAA